MSNPSSETRAASPKAHKISLNLSKNAGPSNTHKFALPKNLKRSHATALQGDDEEDGSAAAASSSSSPGRSQRVSHFDRAAGGAIDSSSRPTATQPTIVISAQASNDWRAAAERRKRQKSGLPHEHHQNHHHTQQNGQGDTDARERELEARKPGFGLIVRPTRSADGGGGEGNGEVRMGVAGEQKGEEEEEERMEENGAESVVRERTDDERAIDALLGRKSGDLALVVQGMTEEETFAHDFRDAPDVSTLDEYARVPVEQFGAAMFRALGGRDGVVAEQPGIGGKKTGKKAGDPRQRRAALLGIGAKEEAAVMSAEMGAWGKNAKRGEEVKIYNPLMLKDTRTGEMFTEDELQKKKEREERERYEMEFDRREREREREREQKRGERGHRRRDDDRRDDCERERRRRDDGSDEEYYRRKEKDRPRRREREDRDSNYDRESSRRHRERDDRDDEYDRERLRRHRDRDERERHRDHDRHRERDRRR